MHDSAPDLVEAIRGWRAWRVVEKDGQVRLMSISNRTVWPPHRCLEATCEKGHPVPRKGCSCGIYAANTEQRLAQLGYAIQAVKLAFGTVSLWGEVVEAEKGYRAALAYPERLYLPHALWPYALQLRQTYGVATQLVNPFKLGHVPTYEEDDGWR
jgi:hypothetical protein